MADHTANEFIKAAHRYKCPECGEWRELSYAGRSKEKARMKCLNCGKLFAVIDEKRELHFPQKNGNRIRSMSDVELAEWITHITPACPPGVDDNDDDNCAARNDCRRCWLDWLKAEVEDGK